VVHLLEEGDLADGGGGDALVLLLEADLLERDRLVGDPVQRLVHHPVRAFPDLLLLLVLHTRTQANKGDQSRRIEAWNPNRARSRSLTCSIATNAVGGGAKGEGGGRRRGGWDSRGGRRGLEDGGEEVGKSGCCCHWGRLALAPGPPRSPLHCAL
jgi:hypothetical protein